MAKYNYDKSLLKDLGVGAFLNEVKVRQQHINEANEEIPTSIYNPNVVSSKLHPAYQLGIISKVEKLKDAKKYTIVPNVYRGVKELAFFRAGQYVSVVVETDDAFMSRPYSICSSPKNAMGKRNNFYEIMVKKTDNGLASEYILNNWKEGYEVVLSGPLGQFYYQRLRDEENVIAIAGGSGITPFLSMARAIRDGIEEFNLTILYGSNTKDSILLKKELDDCVKNSNGKVKVVNVLANQKVRGCETGYISKELINKYASGSYSIFVCGPKGMQEFVKQEIDSLKLPIRRVRYELSGEYGNPTNDKKFPKRSINKTYKVKVWIRGEAKEIECKSDETLLRAIEKAGIKVTSECRSGICGWCHSRLINGKVYIPESNDGRRAADKKFGWIHICATYPLSNIEMEVFPNMQ